MRVMTWNLWWRHGPWRQRWEAIATVLAEVDPDICGLQEVWGGDQENLAAELADRLGRHWCWAGRPPRPHWQREHGADLLFGNAVLSRWPITQRSELDLPVADGQGRIAVHARISTPAGELPFFTTHFSHQLGGSQARLAQARALAGFVAEHADGAYPPVVTGDLNAEPDSDEIRLLGGILTAPAVPRLFFIDAWRYAEPGHPGLTWDHRNGYLTEHPSPSARIDYVLVGLARAGRGRILSARLAGDAPVDGVWPSDHFAVVADLVD